MANYGVGKVIDSTHPEFKSGDLVWGMSGWEEYTLVHQPESLIKINHTELPLSYYTGVLGEPADNFILPPYYKGSRFRQRHDLQK